MLISVDKSTIHSLERLGWVIFFPLLQAKKISLANSELESELFPAKERGQEEHMKSSFRCWLSVFSKVCFSKIFLKKEKKVGFLYISIYRNIPYLYKVKINFPSWNFLLIFSYIFVIGLVTDIRNLLLQNINDKQLMAMVKLKDFAFRL